MSAIIHIHPGTASNPSAIAALQLRTGYSAVITPRGRALLINTRRHKLRTSVHDAHVRAYLMHSFNAALAFLQQRREQHQARQQTRPQSIYTRPEPNGAA